MAPIPGSGLAKGLAVTLRTMTKKTVTAQYPDVQPELPPRTRGVIALFEENCTVSVSYTHLRAPRDLSTSRMPSSA